MIKYARIRIMYALLAPIQRHFRKHRMSEFMEFINTIQNVKPRVLDLGGQPSIWDHVKTPLNIVILNLPGIVNDNYISHHNIKYVVGDACNLAKYNDHEFDIVFSNSVIEHVGGPEKVEMFSKEAMRVGKRLWIQTPSRFFPIEPHTGMPFWWLYPESLRQILILKWKKKLPAWTEMVASTRWIDRTDLIRLFPKATIKVERFAGLPKSYIAIL